MRVLTTSLGCRDFKLKAMICSIVVLFLVIAILAVLPDSNGE